MGLGTTLLLSGTLALQPQVSIDHYITTREAAQEEMPYIHVLKQGPTPRQESYDPSTQEDQGYRFPEHLFIIDYKEGDEHAGNQDVDHKEAWDRRRLFNPGPAKYVYAAGDPPEPFIPEWKKAQNERNARELADQRLADLEAQFDSYKKNMNLIQIPFHR
jgi:hypothetical protein